MCVVRLRHAVLSGFSRRLASFHGGEEALQQSLGAHVARNCRCLTSLLTRYCCRLTSLLTCNRRRLKCNLTSLLTCNRRLLVEDARELILLLRDEL